MENRFESFTIAIGQIYKSIQKIKNFEMIDYGISGNHVMCVYFLGKHPEGLTSTELAEKCDVDKAAISRTLTSLQSDGYIISDSENKKRYRTKIRLTEKGIEVSQIINKKVEGVLNASTDGLNDAKISEFHDILMRIATNLQIICEKNEANNK